MSSTGFFTACLMATVLLIACSDNGADTQESASKAVSSNVALSDTNQIPRVIETFNVGNNVYVRSLLIDQENNSLWVGTSVGVMEIDLASRELRQSFTRDDGLANEYVFAIGEDSKGYKWFGTNAGGASRYHDGEWQVYFPMHGLADYWVYSFAEQKNGNFWIGTWAGVNAVNLDTMEFTTYIKELVNEWVYAIDIDSSDRVWFGTEGGITVYDGKNWRHWTHADGVGAENTGSLPISQNTGLGTRSRHDLSVVVEGSESYNPNYIFSLYIAPDDSVWAGTWGGGAAHFDGTQWTNYTVNDGLSGNIVYSIAQSDNGIYWFGTNHGLSRYDGRSWHNYDMKDGLLGNDVYSLATAPNGDIWIGTINGVMRLGLDNPDNSSVVR